MLRPLSANWVDIYTDGAVAVVDGLRQTVCCSVEPMAVQQALAVLSHARNP